MTGDESSLDSTVSTKDWKWAKVQPLFGESGCSNKACPFHQEPKCNEILCCALNLSDALIRAGYILPAAPNVNHCSHDRVRNADGMARTCNAQNGGTFDASGWANRPSWRGIVYFEGDLAVDFASHIRATGHIDLWNGTQALHAQFPNANVVWFWRMG
jgi:hypothetical protein